MGVILIIIALALLTILCFKGVPVILATLIASVIFAIIADPSTAYEAISATFMGGVATFVQAYFLTFLGGAIFGTLVDMSGAASAIAETITSRVGKKYIVIGVVVVTAILTMGGVSVYVAFFAVYPIAMGLFREADIPRRLFPAVYMLGGGTFTMTGAFSPAIQNIIPTTYLGTTAAAAPVIGVIGMAFTFILGSIYLTWRVGKCAATNEHFVALESDVAATSDKKKPNFIISLIPMIILLVVLNGLSMPIEIALLAAIIAAIILYFPYIPHDLKTLWKNLASGAEGACKTALNTGTTVGFGKVISASAAFQSLIPVVTGIGGSPLIGASVATAVLCCLSGSASGGLGIAIPIVGEIYLPMGVSAAALHRVAAVASSSLDSMPHNGGVITFLNYSHTTHAEGYKDIAVVSVLIPLLEVVLTIILLTALGPI